MSRSAGGRCSRSARSMRSVNGAAVHGGEQGEQVGRGPAAGRLGAVAGPVLVLAQVRCCHGRDAARVEADLAAVGVDAGRGFLEAPSVGFAPGGAGPEAVAAGKLGRDLPVAEPHGPHLLPQGALFCPQARLGVGHHSCLSLAGPRATADRYEVTTINGSRQDTGGKPRLRRWERVLLMAGTDQAGEECWCRSEAVAGRESHLPSTGSDARATRPSGWEPGSLSLRRAE